MALTSTVLASILVFGGSVVFGSLWFRLSDSMVVISDCILRLDRFVPMVAAPWFHLPHLPALLWWILSVSYLLG